MTTIEELDELAEKFIIGHKRLSANQKYILERIEELKKQEMILESKKKRVVNLITIMYKKFAERKND